METALKLLAVTLIALIANIPLGYLRQNCEKFSFGWYFYIHVSIPAIIFLRVKAGFNWHYIPVTIGAAVLGQIIGGRINRRRKQSG